MLLKYFYDTKLAHASYMVGCQRAKVALIVDPGRDIEQYLEAAKREGLKVVAIAETHIHADYVSGARELADRVGARLYVSDEGPAEWKYQFADQYDSHLLKEGDTFELGRIQFETIHTPGHTPESISFLLTDQGGGASKPMGIFTGDFVFVGSIGRPDLLEEAAGVQGSAAAGAKDLYQSVQKFRQLPDYLQVWPAHGAGSACGKGLGAIPSSTVGYEKMYNPALQFDSEETFVEYILADQPDAPKYFAVMKRVNKEGPIVLGHHWSLPELPIEELAQTGDGTLVDVRPVAEFAKGFAKGAWNIPVSLLSPWAGWLVDYDRPVYLIAEEDQREEAIRVMHKMGVETMKGYFDSKKLQQAGLLDQSYDNQTAESLKPRIEAGEMQLIDVRSQSEWDQGYIEQANHLFLGRLKDNLDQLNSDKTIVTQCQSGARSAIAASVLQAAGYDVINLMGGFGGWQKQGLPVCGNGGQQCAAT